MTLSSGGILLIDKEAGLTSAAVVARIRRLLGMKRVGHTGTLDPFATGLLPICFGRATAAAGAIQAWDKVYRCGIKLGSATTTMDPEGQVTHSLADPSACRDFLPGGRGLGRLQEALASLTEETVQEAPAYSAVKVGGKALYHYAREGREVERPLRPIRVYEVRLHEVQEDSQGWPLVYADFRVSSGTYIRSLADLLGQKLACHGHAVWLRRLSVGHFQLDQALTLEALFSRFDELDKKPRALLAALDEAGAILDTGQAYADWPRQDLTLDQAREFSHGRTLALGDGDEGRRAFFYQDRLLAIGQLEGGRGRVKRVFMTPDMLQEER